MLYILLGYMFLFIHRPFEVWPALGELHVERVYILGASIVWFASPGKRLLPTRQDVAIAFFCFAVLAAWLLSPWSNVGQGVVEDYLKIVVFYVLMTTAVTRVDQLRKLSLGFLLIMALYMLHSVWEYKNGRHTYRMGIARLIGVDRTLGDPNSFGASIVYALPFVRLFWLTAQQRLIKLFLAGYAALSGLCILLTGSRSALLGLLVWGLIVILQSQKRLRYLALGTVLAMGAFVALPGDLQNRFETIVNPAAGPKSAQESGQGRILGLVQGWELFQKYPLTGCGPGVWRLATGSKIESHNMYGQLIGELGGLGLLAFATLLGVFGVGIWQLHRWTRGDVSAEGQFLYQLTTALTTALVLLLLEGNFGHNLLRFNWLWYMGFLVIGTRAWSTAALPAERPQAFASWRFARR